MRSSAEKCDSRPFLLSHLPIAIAIAIAAVCACGTAFADADAGAGAPTAFERGLDRLAAVRETGETFRERELARYIDDVRERHAERRAAWERVQAWRERFPAGDYSDVLFIGDSIMDESRWLIHDAMPGCEVNADSGRTLENGGLVREDSEPEYGILDHIRDDEGFYERYVIGAGNNDASGLDRDSAEEIVSCLGPDKEIYFVTMMVTGNPYGTANTNATIDAMVEAYPNVHKIEWHGFVEGRESELLWDYCHPRDSAKPLYVQVLKAGLDACWA